MKKSKAILFIVSFFIAIAGNANVRLPAVIGDNMVLQQKSTAKLWGWAEPNEKIFITTSWNNKTDSTSGNAEAKWQLAIETSAAGGPFTITIKGNNTITLQNILIGEVWICSGQSNMEMNYYWGLPQMKEDIPTSFNPNIRFFHVPRNSAETPQQNGEGNWVACDSNSVKSFSAIAYYFGKHLNAGLNVPVGLIHASWGGTPAEVWTPSETIDNNKILKEAAKKIDRSNGWPITPGYTYNAMIAPLINYTIAGTIWYQGEANTGTASTYHELFSLMIKSWRQKWKKEFPFYYVQLAPYNYGNNNLGGLLREAQMKTLALSKTGMVVTTDLADDTSNIHPRNKRDVGVRLANLALSNTYGKDIKNAASPMFQNMLTIKNEIVLSFVNAEDGLMQKGKTATGFFIAGSDKIFHPAQVKLSGNKIILSGKTVSLPVAVRYAFSNTAIGNIFSKHALPLAPFRTDDWQ